MRGAGEHTWWGACVAGGCVWQGGHAWWGCVWQGGMNGGVCVVGGMHGGGVCMAEKMAIAAGGTHPTRMHSCLSLSTIVHGIDEK